jgi:hypothetical protein
MIAIRAMYDGVDFRPLPSETLPKVTEQVEVAIVFLENTATAEKQTVSPHELALQIRAMRDAMPPLGLDIKDLIEEGRER